MADRAFIIYIRDNGTVDSRQLFPADPRWTILNREFDSVDVHFKRADGGVGQWTSVVPVPAPSPANPAPAPAPAPSPHPDPVPATPPPPAPVPAPAPNPPSPPPPAPAPVPNPPAPVPVPAPAPAPVPPPPPATPVAIKKIVASDDMSAFRGYGMTNPSPGVIENVLLRHHEQAIVVDPNIKGYKPGNRTWRNVRVHRSLRRSQVNAGQAMYLEASGQGDLHKIEEMLSVECGWWPGCGTFKNDRNWAMGYTCFAPGNEPLVAYDGKYLIGVGGGFGFAKFMGDSRCENVIGIDLACGPHATYGKHKLYRGTFYKPTLSLAYGAFTGALGAYLLAPMEMRDCMFIGHGTPDRPPVGSNAKVGCSGLIKCDDWHSQYNRDKGYPTVPGGSVDAKDCAYADWPVGATNDGKWSLWTGSRPHDGSGFRSMSRTSAYDHTPVIKACLANEVSIKEAFYILESGIRATCR